MLRIISQAVAQMPPSEPYLSHNMIVEFLAQASMDKTDGQDIRDTVRREMQQLEERVLAATNLMTDPRFDAVQPDGAPQSTATV